MIINKEVNINKLYNEIVPTHPELISISNHGNDYTFEGVADDSVLQDIVDAHVAFDQSEEDFVGSVHRVKDGYNMMISITCEMHHSAIDTPLNRTDAKEKEDAFIPVGEALCFGMWDRALEAATAIVVTAAVTQAFKDDIRTRVQDYIDEYLGAS